MYKKWWEVFVVGMRSVWSSLQTHLFISFQTLTPYFTSFPFLRCKQIVYTKPPRSPSVPVSNKVLINHFWSYIIDENDIYARKHPALCTSGLTVHSACSFCKNRMAHAIPFLKKYFSISLAVLGLSCGTQRSSVFVAVYSIFSCGIGTLSCNMSYLVPWPGIEPGPLALGV